MLLDPREQEIRNLLDKGLSMEKLAKELGVSFTAVRNFLKAKNLATKAKYSDVKALTPKILELNSLGKTNTEIAAVTGVNLNTVGELLKDKTKAISNIKTTPKRTIVTLQTCHELAAKYGGKFLSPIFTKTKDKFLWECGCGNTWEASVNNIQQGTWCKICASTGKKTDISVLRAFANKKGGKFLDKTYINSEFKGTWECSEGHIWKAPWRDTQRRSWCPSCHEINTRITYDDLQQKANSHGGKIISTDYLDAHSLLDWECEKKHAFKMRWNAVHNGQWCPTCRTGKTSRPMLEIQKFIEDLGFKTELNSRVLDSKEVDVFVPSRKLGIEYHGLVWHSTRVRNIPKDYHKNKYLAAVKNGITLLQIFEDEWLTKAEIVKNLIKTKLGIASSVSHASDFNLKENGDLESFFNATHLAGNTKALYNVYLEKDDEVYAAISLRKLFTVSSKTTIEIARFAVKSNHRIQFAFSRLLKHAEIWAKAKGFTEILTYADCRISTGEVYSKTGFTFIEHTKPNYFYEKDLVREGRFKHRKNNDPEFIAKYGDSELLQNHKQGWYEIYDAGNLKFIKAIK